MKHLLIIVILLLSKQAFTQTKVAILDFENTSGIAKYDGFGKALSNMLITDLKNTIHPRKVVFLERSQLNKILDEQNLQKSKSFDKSTAVSFGKLAGVNFVLVGSVYVLDGKCVINSRFVDVQTSEIVHSKESNGDIKDWLQLKTTLAEELSKAISNPVTIDAQYSESVVTEGVLNQYSKVIEKIDKGDLEEAQEMSEMLLDLQPDFKYFNALQNDIDLIKKDIEDLKSKVEDAIENPEELAIDLINRNTDLMKAMEYLELFDSREDYYSNYNETKKIFVYYQKARLNYRLGNFKESISYYDSCLQIDANFLTAHQNKMQLMMGGRFVDIHEHVEIIDPDQDYLKEIIESFKVITSYGKQNIPSFNNNVFRDTYINDQGKCKNNPNSSNCSFFSYSIELPKKNSSMVFDDLMRDLNISSLSEHISYPTNYVCNYLKEREEYDLAIRILENSIHQQFQLLDRLKNRNSFYHSDRNFDLFRDDSYVHLDEAHAYKYGEIISKFESELFGNRSTVNSLVDNVILLSKLYLSKNELLKSFQLLSFFRKITFDDFEKAQYSDILKIENFKLSLQLLIMFDYAGVEVESLREYIEEIFNSEDKELIVKLFGVEMVSFEAFVKSQVQKFAEEFGKNKNLNSDFSHVLQENRNHLQDFLSIEELKNYYLHNLNDRTVYVRCLYRGIDNENSNQFYHSFRCGDQLSEESLSLTVNRHIFDKEVTELEKIVESRSEPITMIVYISSSGEFTVLDLELGWKDYDELSFSLDKLYNLKLDGTLYDTEFSEKLYDCLNMLDVNHNYFGDMYDCFKTISLNELYTLYSNNPSMLNNLAWAIANIEAPSIKELKVANEMAERATYVLFDTDHHVLDTYALTLFLIGEKDASKKILEKAIRVAEQESDLNSVENYKVKLSKYE